MIEGILFDMDGVLVDSEPAHHAAMREALLRRRLPVPTDDEWEHVFFGRPDRDGLAEWFLMHHLTDDIETIQADKLGLFKDRFPETVRPFADGQWLARQLCAYGLPLALVSGARRAEVDLVLERFDLAHVFQASVSSDDVAAGKPDPMPYVRGAETLGLAVEHCVVIEDSVPGLRAAEAAGADVVVVDRLGRPERFVTVRPVERLGEGVLDDILKRAGISRH